MTFNDMAGWASIIALIITLWQQWKITSTRKEVNAAIKKIQELHKRSKLHTFLGSIREISNELTLISNKTSQRRYRGGRGNEFKVRIEKLLGDLREESVLLSQEQLGVIETLASAVKSTDFEDIENNKTASIEINEKFNKLREDFSRYLSPHSLTNL